MTGQCYNTDRALGKGTSFKEQSSASGFFFFTSSPFTAAETCGGDQTAITDLLPQRGRLNVPGGTSGISHDRGQSGFTE